jgi:hypothetical protein
MNKEIYDLAKESGYKTKTYWTSDDNYKTLAQTEHYMPDPVLDQFSVALIDKCAEAAEVYWNDAGLQKAFSISEYIYTVVG